MVDTLQEVEPTIFLGVPRVWEKIQDKMMAVGKRNKGMKKVIGTWAKKTGLKHNRRILEASVLVVYRVHVSRHLHDSSKFIAILYGSETPKIWHNGVLRTVLGMATTARCRCLFPAGKFTEPPIILCATYFRESGA